METGISARLSPTEGRKFGLTVGAAFVVLAGALLWRGRPVIAGAALIGGVLLVLAGLRLPGRLGPVYRAWMRFGLLLSRVTSPIFLGIVYFALFTPIGSIRRLAGTRLLVRSADAEGYWVRRSESARRSDLERLF